MTPMEDGCILLTSFEGYTGWILNDDRYILSSNVEEPMSTGFKA